MCIRDRFTAPPAPTRRRRLTTPDLCGIREPATQCGVLLFLTGMRPLSPPSGTTGMLSPAFSSQLRSTHRRELSPIPPRSDREEIPPPPLRGRGGYFWVPRGGVELGIGLPASEQEKNTVAGVAMSPTGCERLPRNRPTSLPSLSGNDRTSPEARSCRVGRPGSSETGGFCARM